MRELRKNEIVFANAGHFASIAVISPTTGLPHVTTVWTYYDQGKFYVITRKHRAKYKFIMKGSTKIGINIHPGKGFPYLSVNGFAKIRDENNKDDFWELIEKIVKLYNPSATAQENWLTQMKEAGDRVLIELDPENVYSSV